ncbi:MAG: hypothetical protein NDF55_09530 [archaeon GB-1867-005]|nr:hypothetical protein [Candidatus Culexmicrobium cathedralense]
MKRYKKFFFIFIIFLFISSIFIYNYFSPKKLNTIEENTVNKLLEMNSTYPWHFEYILIKSNFGSLKLLVGIHPIYVNASKLAQGVPHLFKIIIGKISENITIPIITGFTIEIIDLICFDKYFTIFNIGDYWWNMGDHIIINMHLVKYQIPPKNYVLTITLRFRIYALMFVGYFPLQTVEYKINLRVVQ